MAKYRPTISIRTDLSDPSVVTGASTGELVYDAISAKVEAYSITPRTLKSVIEFYPDYVMTVPYDRSNPLTAELYSATEEYSYDGNIVMRYAIRADLITQAAGAILGEGKSVVKAGSLSTGAYTAATAMGATLHSIEKALLTKAITFLVSGPSVTVVVDIFERTNGVDVNVDAAGHPITHSVVLHSNGGQACVIDPSNFLFSSHLKNTNFNEQLRSAALPLIETIHKKLQIYIPDKSVGEGYAFDRYRDCTDIAVKIAFGLNRSPLAVFDYASIKSNPVIISASNIMTTDSSIIASDIPARIKQASSFFAQDTFSKLQSAISDKLKMLAKIEPVSSNTLKSEYKTVMTTVAKHSDILKKLVRFNADLCVNVETILHSQDALVASGSSMFDTECAGLDPKYYDY